MDDTKKLRLQVERTLYTHTRLFMVAQSCHDRAASERDPDDCLVSLVMLAFSMEAYLNFAGRESVEYWSELDRLPVRSKLAVLANHAAIPTDMSKRPFQSLTVLWKFRDLVAHASTSTLVAEVIGRASDEPNYPLHWWESQCQPRIVEQVLQDVRAIADQLHDGLGLSSGRIGMLATQGGTVIGTSTTPTRPAGQGHGADS